ncbi:hypothetical protein NC651_027769 [Populus alba x Populus x berolinensis]|nr:hypothetical protein NC651_027769 [Populus alba x Populus x berolinensis]
MEEELHIQAQPSKTLIKQLASSDTKTRNKSLKILLNKWLPSQPQISEENYEENMERAVLLYFSVFLVTMRREWSGNGVNYHVVSVFVEELKGFLPVKEAALEVIFGNFVECNGEVREGFRGLRIKIALPESNGDEDERRRCQLWFLLIVVWEWKQIFKRQFEKVAAEVGIDEGVTSACDFPKVTGNGNLSKKRKRAKRVELKQYENPESNGQEDAEAGTSTMAKSTEKSAKKVRFSMKNNLIWKPSTPLPPQSLRNNRLL